MDTDSSPNLINLSDSDCPTLKITGNGYEIMSNEIEEGYEAGHNSQEGHSSHPSSNLTSRSHSPSSPGSDSPTPTNSAHDKHWAHIPNTQWQIIANEEHHQLLCTEEESSDKHSSDEKDDDNTLLHPSTQSNFNNGSSSEVREINEDCDIINNEDLWKISEEQEKYYTNQFISMQPDLNGVIPGEVAKKFFEKSKLSISELRHIWQLSDLTRNGSLNLEEFMIAMHLVVSRRNEVILPEKLPVTLYPKSFTWAKFSESPSKIPTLDSPGPKPVNFDFQKNSLITNPTILHPRARRVTPENLVRVCDNLNSNAELNEREKTENLVNIQSEPNFKTYSITHDNNRKYSNGRNTRSNKTGYSTLPPGLDPSCMKNFADIGSEGPTSLPYNIDPSILAHRGSTGMYTVPKTGAPPPPPPRPSRSHARSSSLDLRNLAINQIENRGQNLLLDVNQTGVNGVNQTGVNGVNQTGVQNIADMNRSYHETYDSSLYNTDRQTIKNSVEIINKISPNSAFELYRKPSDSSDNNCEVVKLEAKVQAINLHQEKNFRQNLDSSHNLEHKSMLHNLERDKISRQNIDQKLIGRQNFELNPASRQDDSEKSNFLGSKRNIFSNLQAWREKNGILQRLNSELNQELAEIMEERIALEYQLDKMKSVTS